MSIPDSESASASVVELLDRALISTNSRGNQVPATENRDACELGIEAISSRCNQLISGVVSTSINTSCRNMSYVHSMKPFSLSCMATVDRGSEMAFLQIQCHFFPRRNVDVFSKGLFFSVTRGQFNNLSSESLFHIVCRKSDQQLH